MYFSYFRSGTTNAGNPTPVVNGYSSLQANDRNPTVLNLGEGVELIVSLIFLTVKCGTFVGDIFSL
jgi:hypothetical protein